MDIWKDKKILVVGLGLQGGGAGVCRYFASHGARVTVTDTKSSEALSASVLALKKYPDIIFVLGEHCARDFLSADYIVKGPSVRWDNPHILEAQARGIPVIMETAYFVKHTSARVVGVTGTRGKSTTTTMIFQALNKYYRDGNVYLGGNIPGTCSLELLDSAGERDIVVLELSSWQLSGFHALKISPDVAVFTNIYEDHLNYYHDMASYVFDKTAIFRYQLSTEMCVTLSRTLETLHRYSGRIASRVISCDVTDFPQPLVHLHGHHNMENATLAMRTVSAVLPDVAPGLIADSIAHVPAIRYRQEVIAHKDTIMIVNDSTSTTPIALIRAIEAFADKKLVLMIGGNSKELPLQDLIDTLSAHSAHILSLVPLPGTMTEALLPMLRVIPSVPIAPLYHNFTQSIQYALHEAQVCNEPCCVLFSPGATSFAQFSNEFERGDIFTALVSDIMNK